MINYIYRDLELSVAQLSKAIKAIANLTNTRAEVKNEMYLLRQKTLTAEVERQQQEFSQDIDRYNRYIDEARRKLADLSIFIVTMI